MPVDLEITGAVYAGGIEHVVGDAFHVLADEKDAEGADEAGDDEGEVGVIEPEFCEDEEAGDEGYGVGNHEGGYEDGEEGSLEWELKFCEAEGGEAVEEDAEDYGDCGNEEAVEVPPGIAGFQPVGEAAIDELVPVKEDFVILEEFAADVGPASL